MRLSPLTPPQALSIRNNSFKQNKQNGLSFKGEFRIGKNPEKTKKTNALATRHHFNNKLDDFVKFCNDHTHNDMKGYIDVGNSPNPDWAGTFKVVVYDNEDGLLAASFVCDEEQDYVNKAFNEAKKELQKWQEKRGSQIKKIVACLADAGDNNEVNDIGNKLQSAPHSSIRALSRIIEIDRIGKFTPDKTRKILGIKFPTSAEDHSFVFDYVIPKCDTVDEIVEIMERYAEENKEDIDITYKYAEYKCDYKIRSSCYMTALKFGFHTTAKILETSIIQEENKPFAFNTLSKLAPVMEKEGISTLDMTDDELEWLLKIINYVLPYNEGKYRERFSPEDIFSLYQELKDYNIAEKDFEEVLRRSNNKQPLSVKRIIEVLKDKDLGRTLMDKEILLVRAYANDEEQLRRVISLIEEGNAGEIESELRKLGYGKGGY